MPEKGFGYARTQWSYGERPVTAAKLNDWDAHIARAFVLAWRLLNHGFGGGDGVVSGLDDALQASALIPPGPGARVGAGVAFIGERPFVLGEPVNTREVTPLEEHPRIDLVQARAEDGAIVIKDGAEHETPVAPEPYPDCLPLAYLHLRPAMTVIKDTDDGVNGFIEDARDFIGG